ncbi:hypothetical protein BB560_004145 [Smittium megazygosporum]|uniref:Uncharacterized protein n=1 Tax=Smittium megazygosporum TaxID=133381 RepID=A0A2T9ZA42_9FUNG|nr:hypothetical protein BB560_004145 [Smittium megazygosporum]
MTLNADINPKPNWWHVVASNGATVPNSNNTEYKFLLYDGFEIDNTTSKQLATRGQNLFTSGPKISYGTNIRYFVLHDENGSKMGMNGYISEYQSNIIPLNDILMKSPANIALTADKQGIITLTPPPPPPTSTVPKTTSTTTVLATIATVTQSTTTSSTVFTTVVKPTTIATTVTTTTTSPTTVLVSASPNYSENDKISIPCSEDFTLPVTSNSIDSDLFFGSVDAIGVAKNGRYIELQVGIKNGQNSVKDLVVAQIRRRLFKKDEIAKVTLIYVNGIYSLLSNGQSLTTFKGSSVVPKSLTITPYDGTVTLSNFVLTCM